MLPSNRRELTEAIPSLRGTLEKLAAARAFARRSGKNKELLAYAALIEQYVSEATHCVELFAFDVAERLERVERWIGRAPKQQSAGGRRPSRRGIRRR